MQERDVSIILEIKEFSETLEKMEETSLASTRMRSGADGLGNHGVDLPVTIATNPTKVLPTPADSNTIKLHVSRNRYCACGQGKRRAFGFKQVQRGLSNSKRGKLIGKTCRVK